jgi:hypothetical protein
MWRRVKIETLGPATYVIVMPSGRFLQRVGLGPDACVAWETMVTGEKEVQDNSCRGSGGVPQL